MLMLQYRKKGSLKQQKEKGKGKLLSHVRLFATPCTAAYQAPLSTGLSRQEYWSGGNLLNISERLRDLISSSAKMPALDYICCLSALTAYEHTLFLPFSRLGGGDLVAQSCLTLCGPMDHSPQDSSVCGISQARVLE